MAHRETRPACEALQEAFLAWMDEELGPDRKKGLELHLRECPFCVKEWEGYRATVALLRSLEPLEVPDRVLHRVRERIQRRPVWVRLSQWIMPLPQRIPSHALAAVAVLVVVFGLWQFTPWMSWHQIPAPAGLSAKVAPSPPVDITPVSTSGSSSRRILPGPEELLNSVRSLEAEWERPLMGRATLQDDLVLDLKGSEEVFGEVESILREVHGRMFLMGVRHRGSGEVIRSRVLIQVPMESYDRVVGKLESLGSVKRLFLERGAVPPPPDRLRIRVLAVDSPLESLPNPIREVSLE